MLTILLLAITLPLVPDAILTPGGLDVRGTRAAVCVPGYSDTVRDVSLETKLAVYAAYGLTPGGRFKIALSGRRTWQSDFEVDHFEPLTLGGSNEMKNLWPQSYRTPHYNAWAKDALENRLHWLVCHNKLSLSAAQGAIRSDWRVAYDMFITHGPVKGTP